MKAMIFAAGLGTRLRPLTNDRPKALVEVAGKPMLRRVIDNLVSYGFDDIVVNVHHFGEKIIDYVAQNNAFGVNIHISDERGLLLDTGGGILKAREWLDGDEPFLVHNADILTDLNLCDFYDYHCRHQADASLLTKERVTARYLIFDASDRLSGWINKSTGQVLPEGLDYRPGAFKEMAFGGVHVISPRIFTALDEYARSIAPDGDAEVKFSIVPFYVAMCRRLKIMSYAPDGYR
ncbi:MAG: NDP-sugar synthase, partial [Muribaculaceae bacterium]